MNLLYNIAVSAYTTAIKLASLFNPKANQWVEGRKGLLQKIKSAVHSSENIIWFHCASLGEFEQGRPVMESLKKDFPTFKILLTFFSPSGYEIRKNYSGADWVFYLPADTPKNAQTFINTVNPRLAVFVKYEFWHNYILELSKQSIPLLLISAKFRKDQVFFQPYGGFFRKMLRHIRHIYVQDEASHLLLTNVDINNVTIAGDTRFDRVYQTSLQKNRITEIELFCADSPVIVAGSTWPEDEKLLFAVFKKLNAEYKIIIAPHEVHEHSVSALTKLFSEYKPLKFSELNQTQLPESKVLIIDNIGMLSKLYAYASIAYIGGGFGKGIHNILEAATFGIPVVFGPNYKKFKEAEDLIQNGGGFSVRNEIEAINAFSRFDQREAREKAGKTAELYISENTGATSVILKKIKNLLLQS
jgi:3-deoxy-D-manno-octulosonic-acid transferase